MSVMVVDTETTGLPLRRNQPPSSFNNWNNCRLVQVAWQVHERNTGALLSRQQLVVKPVGFDISNAHIHGITTEFAKEHGVLIGAVFNALASALSGVDVIVAHNVEFDKGVLLAELYRSMDVSDGETALLNAGDEVQARWSSLGIWYPGVIQRQQANGNYDVKYEDGMSEQNVDPALVRSKVIVSNGRLIQRFCSISTQCTMRMATKKLQRTGDKWLKLVELYTRLFPQEAPPARLHCADADVELCAKCYFAMIVL